MSKDKYCSVIGCGRKYSLKMVTNPFAPEDKPIALCERCLRAGTEAVQRGKSELTQDIYERYYTNYPKKYPHTKQQIRNKYNRKEKMMNKKYPYWKKNEVLCPICKQYSCEYLVSLNDLEKGDKKVVSQKTFIKLAKHKSELEVHIGATRLERPPRTEIYFEGHYGFKTLVRFGNEKRFLEKINQERSKNRWTSNH